MNKFLQNYINELQPREKLVLGAGAVAVFLLLFYVLILQPWHKAIGNMQRSLQKQRVDVVWMRQQAEIIKNGGVIEVAKVKGADQSLMSIVEKTAKSNGVQKSIKQMTPRTGGTKVSIVLEEAPFSKWVRWTNVLHKEYGIKVFQLSAEREGEEPDIAEIRVIFERSS